uniref:LLGL domain-containing protein n=1 Tax=Trichuris muris TaxID=70415 RepID=A0A5S6QJ98_TRIMR
MDLLKYLRSKFPGVSAADSKERIASEFFQYRKTFRFGFPSQPSCLACDEYLGFIAVGTRTGLLKVLGQPGVEFTNDTKSQLSFVSLFFLPRQMRLVAFCQDQSFHLFGINVRDGRFCLDHMKKCSTTGRLKQISCCCLGEYNGACCIFAGTESGNVYSLNTRTFEIIDCIIYQEAIAPKIPEDFKLNPGAVEAFAVHPTNPNKLLLGYNRGLVVLWDFALGRTCGTFVASHKVESLCWHDEEEKFCSSHTDGSYITWFPKMDAPVQMDVRSPFGPFPCKSIIKIVTHSSRRYNEDYLFFIGGMPRAAYSDRNVVSVQLGEKQVVFDFTSQVLDFVVFIADKESGCGEPEALFVLCEEELVAIDLLSDDWLCWRLPYLQPFHASPVTACFYLPDVPRSTFSRIRSAGLQRTASDRKYSERSWPLKGGHCNRGNSPQCLDILVTGHEDGSVKFWHGSLPAFPMIYSISSAILFEGYIELSDLDADPDEWPPFRKVGSYDPFSDDARFTVHRLSLDSDGTWLLVGGAAGQISLWELCDEAVECAIKAVDISLVEETLHFEWKGHDRLKLRSECISFKPGFRLVSLIQCFPPASIASAAVNMNWGLIAFGTAHGYAVFDSRNSQVVLRRCLLSAADLTPAVTVSETTISRYKSFKKSLRESFRRKRKPLVLDNSSAKTSPMSQHHNKMCNNYQIGLQPVERAIEARNETKQLGSLVRFISFAQVSIVSGCSLSPTLWVGTNAGVVLAYLLQVPDEKGERICCDVTCILAKEIRLRHAAPVLTIYFIDIPRSHSNDHNEHSGTSESQRIVVCSEEQLKAFSLPTLKPLRQKYRLTAIEGSRIIKTQMVCLKSAPADQCGSQRFILVLTNLGCIPSYFISGVLSAVLTSRGEGFYLLSSAEWQRFSVAASYSVCIDCSVDLPSYDRINAATSNSVSELNPLNGSCSESPPSGGKLSTSSPLETSNLTGDDSVSDYLAPSDTVGVVTTGEVADVPEQKCTEERKIVA